MAPAVKTFSASETNEILMKFAADNSIPPDKADEFFGQFMQTQGFWKNGFEISTKIMAVYKLKLDNGHILQAEVLRM